MSVPMAIFVAKEYFSLEDIRAVHFLVTKSLTGASVSAEGGKRHAGITSWGFPINWIIWQMP